MPDLPTLTVTAEQEQRILAAFGTADAYRDWLRAQITTAVTRIEVNAIAAKMETQMDAKAAEVRSALEATQ